MQQQHLPSINTRYWIAIIAASMCGANTGDFAARFLHMGHTGGLLPLALIFGIILWVERKSTRATELYYWLAIIVLRTAATNLADLSTHDLKLGYELVELGLAALMILILVIGHIRGVPLKTIETADGLVHNLPATDTSYWITMLAAGTLGTALGDWVAEELGLGLFLGSAVLTALFAVILFVSMRAGHMQKPWYWLSIVAARTAGTDLGDLLASKRGLNLGLPLSTLCTALLLIAILVLWRDNRVAQPQQA